MELYQKKKIIENKNLLIENENTSWLGHLQRRKQLTPITMSLDKREEACGGGDLEARSSASVDEKNGSKGKGGREVELGGRKEYSSL